MLCPLDQTELRPVERQGVEIDYCPRCRGVWLDRGELDKLIDRTVEALGRAPAGGGAGWTDDRARGEEAHPYDRLYGRPDRDEARPRRGDTEDERAGHRGRRRRRDSWFEDLFDFD
jgi:hypothetical protein